MELSYRIRPVPSATSTRVPWAFSSTAMVCSTPSWVRVSDTARAEPMTRACCFKVLSLEANTIFSTISRGYVFITMRMAATTSR